MIDRITLAHRMYTLYCKEVGGKAFNGDTLPSAEEFFADETKNKQSNAWLEVADDVLRLFNNNF